MTVYQCWKNVDIGELDDYTIIRVRLMTREGSTILTESNNSLAYFYFLCTRATVVKVAMRRAICSNIRFESCFDRIVNQRRIEGKRIDRGTNSKFVSN
jgi:hypothetical protein